MYHSAPKSVIVSNSYYFYSVIYCKEKDAGSFSLCELLSFVKEGQRWLNLTASNPLSVHSRADLSPVSYLSRSRAMVSSLEHQQPRLAGSQALRHGDGVTASAGWRRVSAAGRGRAPKRPHCSVLADAVPAAVLSLLVFPPFQAILMEKEETWTAAE